MWETSFTDELSQIVKMGNVWKAMTGLPESWKAMRGARKTVTEAGKTMKWKEKTKKSPISSSTYRAAKTRKEEAMREWGEAGKHVAKGLIVPGGIAATAATGGVIHGKSRKKRR